MSDHSKIEWTEATWNPTTGCTKVSAGCDHCYIDRTPPFRMQGRKFLPLDVTTGASTGVLLHPERLDQPLRWRKPRRIFVNSLSDLFHDDVPEQFIARVFGVMAVARQHTFQVLTKRHARMRSLLASETFREHVFLSNNLDQGDVLGDDWPLPNVWLGVSVENQQWADIRIPALLDTPAAVRFLSCEPLLGPVHLFTPYDEYPVHGGLVDWVIVGGESGPSARPMHPDWARSLRDQCTAAGVPYFFKQWGEWAPAPPPEDPRKVRRRAVHLRPDGTHERLGHLDPMNGTRLELWGKHAAGRELDGRTWDEMPDRTAVSV